MNKNQQTLVFIVGNWGLRVKRSDLVKALSCVLLPADCVPVRDRAQRGIPCKAKNQGVVLSTDRCKSYTMRVKHNCFYEAIKPEQIELYCQKHFR
ncbi:hypothetical protein [Egbenema bharatensis]|uniref:hypothetical protein n=1 Tax=Egbenema bharatensis TaxID=3463334 RepID=UPI003A87C88D